MFNTKDKKHNKQDTILYRLWICISIELYKALTAQIQSAYNRFNIHRACKVNNTDCQLQGSTTSHVINDIM